MSARMKDFKQLMKIGDLTMAERVVVNFRQAGVNDIVMVTGYQGKKLEKELRHLGTTFLRNDDYETTQMFDSAKIGFTYLKDRCDRILFCPADVPFSWMRPWMNCLSKKGSLCFPYAEMRSATPYVLIVRYYLESWSTRAIMA